MLQGIAIFLLLCLAIDTTRKIYAQRAIFSEHGQSIMAAWLVWLCPLPLVLPFVSRQFWVLFFPIPISALFFVPALVVANVNRKSFEKSGDNRVKSAAATVAGLITFGCMGLAGMLVFTVWLWTRKH
ncbi:MAG TPA: hypothetical protein VHI52_14020 [Verrucomicrobiae bacterium]|nr:hypothetical protein [Verrucomicrobiae bacterium]